ncbi:MAG: hypothetical protein L0241_10880 [Planctomycetia bacterium]|nr:hypothetical protein [Planctomycetia bacterium]
MADDSEFDAEPDLREIWWRTASHPRELLEFLEDHKRGRKWRLFMCACGRRCLEQMPGEVYRKAVALGEAYADGEASTEMMESVAVVAFGELDNHRQHPEAYAAGYVAVAVASLGGSHLFDVTLHLSGCAASVGKNQAAEFAVQADFVRDIFGNPFRSVIFSSEWRTDTAVSLARTMYESRDFSLMPILADALQDAGCDNEDILSHCRDANQVHVRGCWVVDLVLGKQ